MKNRGILCWITWILVMIGALNWGLVGAFDLNLVQAIFGGMPQVVSTVYILVGLSAVYMVIKKFTGCCK